MPAPQILKWIDFWSVVCDSRIPKKARDGLITYADKEPLIALVEVILNLRRWNIPIESSFEKIILKHKEFLRKMLVGRKSQKQLKNMLKSRRGALFLKDNILPNLLRRVQSLESSGGFSEILEADTDKEENEGAAATVGEGEALDTTE